MDPPSYSTRMDAADESGGSGAEGRARKRFQRTNTAENENPVYNYTKTSNMGESRPGFAARRRSTLRENKAPLLGPRPLELTQTKRVISDTHALTNNGTRSYLPSYINEPMLNQSPPKPRNNPRYSFSRQPSNYIEDVSNAPFDFLPSVNFDDFHASINPNSDLFSNDVSTAPTVTAPTDVRPRMLGQAGRAASSRNTSICTSSLTSSKPEDKAEDSAVSPSRSLVRRLSNARRQPSQGSTGSANMPPPNQPSAPRGRRQSTLPTSTAKDTTPNANISRPPRKSIGPGTLTANYNGRSSVDSGASNPSYTTQSALNRTTSINRQRGSTLQQPKTTQPEAPKLATSARAAKAKSMQPTSEQAQQARQFLTSITPINTTSPSLPAAKSPGRSPGRNVGTPTSGKRQSVHVGGLGARTISPTDARRLKRLSQMQSSTPAPQTPPTPQPDFPQGIRLPLHPPPPPAMPSRKSVTPSSARGTPDAGRKQSLSTQPLSQSSSHSSLRGAQPPPMPSMPMPAPARNSQILSSSRLPTAKPRNVHSSAGFVEEEVPPVPAIPKAYESPKEQIETPFFSDHYPVPPNAGLPSSSGHRSRLADPEDPHAGAYTEPPPLSAAFSRPSPRPSLEVKPVETGSGTERQYAPGQNPRHRRGMTVGTGETDKAAAVPNAKRTTLQPVRLPPLNLLPLSTPTSNRIAAFPAPSLEVDRRAGTPPKRINTKTPSTPMTASKATFTRSLRDEDEYAAFNLRSASSFNFKPDASMYHPTDMSPELVMPPPNARTTPFSSGSLPKESGDFHYYMSQAQEHTEEPLSSASETAPELGSMISPRTQVPPQFQQHIEKERKPSSAHTANSTTDEPGTPSSGTSLRRKLSLGWRRSSSKASNKNSEEEAPKASKRNEMPPPKLPASAMWNGNVTSSPSPSIHSGRPSLDSRRRKSSVNTVRSSMDQGRSSGENGLHAQRPIRTTTHPPPPAYAEHAAAKKERAQSRSSSSLLTPMQRMLGNRSSMSALKARNLDTNLDKDDLAADKVMEKLVSKRKDFEAAARNVDELRKRAHPKERVSPAQALQMVNLNIFERGEIIDYREIYFCGTKDAKKHVGDLNSPSGANFGYDDDRGDYNIVMGDHLAYRYEVVDMLGKGSFGQVVRCVDHKTGGLVAVKIIRNKKRFHQQALVEVNILQKLREWDPDNRHSMINFTQSFYFRGHLCISTELLGMNLYEFIKAYEFKGFPLPLIRRFSKQILSSLVLLKSRRVIHCDLKPENILLAHPLHSEIKVIDFGSSCFENEKVYTYIQSRFYRSPEVILGMSYGIPIDMWSLGCILAELLTGYPIFPGENEQEQLACIMEIFGPPEKHLIEKSSRKKLFFDSLGKPRVTVSSKGRRRRPSSKTLQQALKCDDEAFLDFITRCLRWDPERRMRPDEAMQHEFVTGIKRSVPSTGTRVRSAQAVGMHTNHATAAASGAMSAATPAKRSVTAGQVQSTPHAQSGTTSSAQRTRPLPEPPATSLRNGAPVSNASNSNASPVKGAPRRHSTVNGVTSIGAKRVGNVSVVGGAGIGQFGSGPNVSGGTSLPRATSGTQMQSQGARSVSHGQLGTGHGSREHIGGQRGGDLANAAALASLRAR